jgi:hypothetical protein
MYLSPKSRPGVSTPKKKIKKKTPKSRPADYKNLPKVVPPTKIPLPDPAVTTYKPAEIFENHIFLNFPRVPSFDYKAHSNFLIYNV